MDKKVVVQNRGSVWHEKRLLGLLCPGRGSYLFKEKFIVRRYQQRPAAIAPLIADQFSAGGHLHLRMLGRMGSTGSFLQLRFDVANAVLLRHAEGLRDYP